MMHPLIQTRLQSVVDRQGRLQFWFRLAGCWTVTALLGLGLIMLQRRVGWASSLVLPMIAALGVAAAMVVAWRHRTAQSDWRRAAADIEARQPKLDGRLLTVVQQETNEGGELNYLQDRLVHEVVAQQSQDYWAEISAESQISTAQLAHVLALVFFGAVLLGLRTTGGHSLLARISDSAITVTPGDTSIERGNSLVVLTRFGGALPVSVDLMVGDASTSSRRIPLVKSLADAMFGGSVSEVTSNLVYHVEYAGQRTRDFKVTVFEHPRLERADVDLTFPEYTGQSPKHIKDTRRLSAVEGSRLDLTIQLNKPVVSARLVAKDDDRNAVPLLVETNRAVAELKQFNLVASKTYELQLVDAENRTNKVPAQFVFDVLKNRTPEMKLAAPRGDVRPSALEEISFEGTVWDDFGVQAYGLAYTLIGKELKIIELGQAVPAREKRSFEKVLRLEDLGLQPDELISWFVWADDLGPDGKIRRTTGDLFFAEVRPFEEIFREGQAMDGQSGEQPGGQAGNRTAKLAELQKQIINATWKLQREQGGSGKPVPPRPPARRETEKSNPPTSDSRSGDISNRFVAQISKPAVSRVSKPADRKTTDSLPTWKSATQQVWKPPLQVPLLQFAGQRAQEPSAPNNASKDGRVVPEKTSTQNTGASYESDTVVVLDSQAQALEQAQTALEGQQDPRAAILWRNATTEMEKALNRLKAATNSPAALAEALAAEQAAYQALLKLQEHEYQVTRSQSRNQRGGGGREQQMQRQLEQMDLTQSENRYETQRQAQAPQNAGRREQLQVMNRLQELAQRQQDLNDRLKELQTALQEAHTEQEREEIRRRLKRLQEEEQQMLADVDEVRQRMDRPENQSRMAEERKQLEQTRNDVQRAAEAAGQNAASQALASGTRAQRQLQELRDRMRKENSSQFAEDLREMRAEARELAQRQEDIAKKMQSEKADERKSLSDSDDHRDTIDQLMRQREHTTNLVDRATQVSEQAENAEPLLSRQLYDAVRKFSQDSAKSVKDVQEELLNRGLMTRSLYDKLKETSQPDSAKLLELTSELLRQDFKPQANGTEQRVRAGLNDLKRGVERAAESVLGDDTEALRLAQQELDHLTDQLQREIAQAETGQARTNPSPTQGAESGNQSANSLPSNNDQPTQSQPAGQQPGPASQASGQGRQPSDRAEAREDSAGQSTPGRSANQPSPAAQGGRRGAARNGGPNVANSGGDGNFSRGGSRFDLDRILDQNAASPTGPITGENFAPWSDRLRDVEEMIDFPDLRNGVATARERARLMRQEFKRDLKKPDWAIVRLQVIKPLVEVRDRITEELARRQSTDSLVPIDRDPVPTRYSERVRRYYEELGKDK